MTKTRNIKESDTKLLYGRSAGRCNICRESVFKATNDGLAYTHRGEMAHNIAHSSNPISPRCIDKQSGNNSYDNLILLCANHHKDIDQDTRYYTVEKLLQIKKDFEAEIAAFSTLPTKVHQHDLVTVKQVNSWCSFLEIIYGLDDPDYKIPAAFLGIIDCYHEYLLKNKPTYFPFYDEHLNKLMDRMYAQCVQLDELLLDNHYYCSEIYTDYLMPLKQLEPSIREQIISCAETLAQDIYNWLDYCREIEL